VLSTIDRSTLALSAVQADAMVLGFGLFQRGKLPRQGAERLV